MMNDFLSEPVFVRGLTRYLNRRFSTITSKKYIYNSKHNLTLRSKPIIFVDNLCRAYANSVQDDLWTALQEQAIEDNIKLPATMKEIMVNQGKLKPV